MRENNLHSLVEHYSYKNTVTKKLLGYSDAAVPCQGLVQQEKPCVAGDSRPF